MYVMECKGMFILEMARQSAERERERERDDRNKDMIEYI